MPNTLTRNILFVLVACVAIWKFVTFSQIVKEDLIWYSNSDQTGWVLFSSLEFNDDKPCKYISHPGVSTSYVYGLGLKVMKTLGLVEISKSSDLESDDDPMRFFPQLYERGAHVSIIVILLCAMFMGLIIYQLTEKRWELGAFAFVMTLFSCGFLFHSVMLRNELTSVYYFILSLFIFQYAYFRSGLDSWKETCALASAGLMLGLAYFAKSQVIVTTVMFFLFLLYYHFSRSHRERAFSLVDNLLLTIGHIVSFALVAFWLGVELPIFWKLVYGLSLGFSLLSFLNLKLTDSKIIDFVQVLNRFSLGFTLSIAYTIVRGLKGETRGAGKILTYTSFWNPGEKSIQAQTLDKDMSSILARFGYFLQAYMIESMLLVSIISAIYFFVKKQSKWKYYLFTLLLIVVSCYMNSMRSNLTANLGRSVFKYIIYIDIAVIIMVALSYRDLLLTYAKKNFVHAIFWIFLLGFGFNNCRKVQKDTDWNWTTYSDIVFPERWLFPGAPPYARKVLKEKYKGYINGHDRVIFGDEMVRNGKLNIPGGERHLARVQKLSAEPYLNRIEKLLALDKGDIEQVVNTEKRLLNVKINAFIAGDDYKTIVEKATDKRKFLYKKVLDLEQYNKYIKLVESGRLSVPF